MKLIVREDEFWPWRTFVDKDRYGFAVGLIEVDDETAARWADAIAAAEAVQDEISAALFATYPGTGRKPRS